MKNNRKNRGLVFIRYKNRIGSWANKKQIKRVTAWYFRHEGWKLSKVNNPAPFPVEVEFSRWEQEPMFIVDTKLMTKQP